MSIPPLVCSTPPPPEQCVDDKDPEDFDLQYNLSQDDDENSNYDFGGFSNYDHYQTSLPENQPSDLSSEPNEIQNTENSCNESEQLNDVMILKTCESGESQLKIEEEINIEDLNLKVNENQISNIKNYQVENKTVLEETDESVSKMHKNAEDQQDNSSITDEHNEKTVYNEESTQIQENLPNIEDSIADKVSEELPGDLTTFAQSEHVKELNDNSSETKDDEFTDFDAFNLKSEDDTFEDVINNSNDPWANAETVDSENNDFGDFKANFKENIITEQSYSELLSQSNTVFNTVSQGQNLDDDFGDFDDFKSSEVAAKGLNSHVPVFNIQSSDNENQVIESVNNVLFTIFELEIPNEVPLLEENFNSLLSETWHHLKEVDIRQPYMVTWNNSLGQKTLLKALCIDSRNILFGPKWSYNMPKYATNLSAAPLQPQKHSTGTVISQNEQMAFEKNVIKATESWTDPFAADGQESCSPENNATAKTENGRYMFKDTLKTEKVFSNTPSVQPLRQISLPDTHIFTPTDSETPRSKTIHYDSGPPVLLQNTVDKKDKKQIDKSNIPHKLAETTNEFEYSDFEEFQSSNDTKSNITAQPLENSPSASTSGVPVVYQTQILQPIKVEPIIPTVNWPDPGEVKVTYEDFTDFISNSSWNHDKKRSTEIADHQSKTANGIMDNNLCEINNSFDNNSIQESLKDSTVFADDFETFQSAPIVRTTEQKFNHSHINTITNHTAGIAENITSTNLNKNYTTVKNDKSNVKSDAISFANMSKTNETVKQNKPIFINREETVLRSLEIAPKLSPVQSNNLLQPTPVVSLHNQHQAGQILQPLSLESYSQINWPNPGIDLHDLSRFNPVESLKSLKSDLSVNAQSKVSSPVHNKKGLHNQTLDDDVWGDFVSSKPINQPQPNKSSTFADDDEWSEFVSSPIVKPQNGLSTISLNVHTNLNMQKSSTHNKTPLDIPSLNYITPKSSNYKPYTDQHFQNL